MENNKENIKENDNFEKKPFIEFKLKQNPNPKKKDDFKKKPKNPKRELKKRDFVTSIFNIIHYYKTDKKMKEKIENLENSEKIIEGFKKKETMIYFGFFLGGVTCFSSIYFLRKTKILFIFKFPIYLMSFGLGLSSVAIHDKIIMKDIYGEDFDRVRNDSEINEILEKEFDKFF